MLVAVEQHVIIRVIIYVIIHAIFYLGISRRYVESVCVGYFLSRYDGSGH